MWKIGTYLRFKEERSLFVKVIAYHYREVKVLIISERKNVSKGCIAAEVGSSYIITKGEFNLYIEESFKQYLKCL